MMFLQPNKVTGVRNSNDISPGDIIPGTELMRNLSSTNAMHLSGDGFV